MPEISVFCPGCGLPVKSEHELSVTDSANLDSRERLLGAAAYLTFVPAILFLVIPPVKSRRFVRFHSWQSILFAVSAGIFALALKLVFVVLSILPLIGFLVAWLSLGVGFLAIVALWAVLVAKAAQGRTYELPFIGPLAVRLTELDTLR